MNWHDYFTYDPEKGILIWKERSNELFSSPARARAINTRLAGRSAGYYTGPSK